MAVGIVKSTKTAKEVFDEFEKSPDEVPHINGAPTFLQLHEIIQYIEGNCMAIADDRDLNIKVWQGPPFNGHIRPPKWTGSTDPTVGTAPEYGRPGGRTNPSKLGQLQQ